MNHNHLWLTIALILGLAVLAPGQEWEWQNPLPQGNNLNDVVWMTSTTVLAVGDFNTILRSTDAGSTWTIIGQNSTEPLRSISRVNDQVAWVLGYYGSVLMTSDGGLTWQARHDSAGNYSMYCIDFVNSAIGWAGGYHGSCAAIWYTNDSGQSWMEQQVPGCAGIQDIDFVNDSTGWAVGGYMIRHTTDGGATWTEQVWYDSTNEEHFYLSLVAVDFTDELNGWVVGERILHTTDGGQTWSGADSIAWATDVEFLSPQIGALVGLEQIYLTDDGGQNWTEINPQAPSFLFDGLSAIAMLDTERSVLVGGAGEVLKSDDGGATWQLLSAQLISSFQDVCFVDTLNGWAVGDNYNDACIVHTTDGGLTWTPQSVDPPVVFEGLFFLDHLRGWAVGNGNGGLCRTTDGGQTWLHSYIEDFGALLMNVHFVDSLNGWAVGWGQTIIRTRDGGVTWTLLHEGPDIHFYDVQFVSPETGWLVGCEGVIWHTTDGGETWDEQFHDAQMCLHQLSFVDAWTGFVAGGDVSWRGVILKTTDGGENWIRDERDYPYFRGIEFYNRWIGWAVRPSYELYRTLDGGETWTPFSTGTSNWIGDISFGAVNQVWAVGENGTILHLADTITAANEIPEALLPSSYSLSAFPNPFNSSTSLSYDLPVTGIVNLSLFDLTGRLVRTLEDRIIPQGHHTLNFDGSNLPSGMYFVRLNANSFSTTQKLLLLK